MDSEGFTAQQRQVRIVAKLFTTTRKSLTSTQLREALVDVGFHPQPGETWTAKRRDAANERMRKDLKILQQRGLIETVEESDPTEVDEEVFAGDLPSDQLSDPLNFEPDMSQDEFDAVINDAAPPPDDLRRPKQRKASGKNSGRATRVRYALPRKSHALFLTRQEHAALARARKSLRPGVPKISPYHADHQKKINPLDQYGIVVRYLEESGGQLTVNEMKHLFNYRNLKDAGKAISELLSIDDSSFEQVGLEVITDAKGVIAGIRSNFSRQTERPMRQGSGGGLNPHGRFEYTLPETEERLDLIAEARGNISAADWQLLLSAQDKLSQWRDILMNLAATPHH